MNKFEDTVKEMESQVQELEENLAKEVKDLDEEGKEKARILVSKTEEAIKSSIEKVRSVIENVKEDEKVEEFLDKVKAKSMEAVEFTKEKIAELSSKTEPTNNETLDKVGGDILAEFDKIKESETMKNITDFLTDINKKMNEFFEKPEVKEVINKAKVTTVNIAEKGVEGLKKVLNTEETSQNNNQEEPKE